MIPRALVPARRRLLVLLTAVAVVLAGALTVAGPASAAPRTLEGVVRLISDAPRDRDGGHSPREELVLVVGDKAYKVKGRALTPNTRVRISGLLTGRTVDVASAQVLGEEPAQLPPSGTTRSLVMLVEWAGLPRDGVTQASAAQQMFTDTNGWYREASYGAVGITGDVTPWMTITAPAGNKCYAEMHTIMDQATSQAAARGYDWQSYDSLVVYFPWAGGLPGSDCGTSAGWAYIGGNSVWLNGYMDRRVTVHELGHNFGLEHSNSYMCPGGGIGTTGCTYSEYGDDYDAMGAWDAAHFSASQKHRLQWMGGGRTLDWTEGGSAKLVPMTEATSAPHIAQIRARADRTYWLEYRRPDGYDAVLPPGGHDGVLLHVEDYGISFGPALLDASPSDGVGVPTASLKPGQTWTSPEGYKVTLASMDASGAQVSVVAPAGDRTAPAVTARTPAPGGTGASTTANVTATFSEPVVGVNGTTFSLYSPTGPKVAATVTYNSTTRTATLDPGAALLPDTRYSADLWGGTSTIRDVAGNPLPGETWSFTTGPAPTLTARSPANGATSVSTVANLTLTFSERVVGVSGSTFSVRTPSGTVVPATVSYNSTTRTATLNPTANLPADVRYTATVTGGPSAVRDAAGNPLATSTWTFTTGPAPTVSSRYPASGQTGISRTADVAAVFSEAVQGVSTTTATLRSPAGTVVSAVVAYNATTRRLTLNPSSTLAARTTYTATLTGGTTAIRDLAGNPLPTTRWSFTTGA